MTLPGIQGFCQEHQRDWLYLMRGRNNQEFHQILYEQLHFCSLLPRATNFGEVASAVRRNANRPSSFNLERFFLFLFLQKVQDAEYNQWLQDHPTGPPILYCILLHWSMITTSIGLLCITLQDPPKTVDPCWSLWERFHQVTERQVKAWDYPWLVLELARGSLRWVPHEPTARTIICWRLLASQFENSKYPRQEIQNTRVGELQHVPADEMMVWLNPQSLTATSRKRGFSAKGVKGITWSWCTYSLFAVDGKKHHNK